MPAWSRHGYTPNYSRAPRRWPSVMHQPNEGTRLPVSLPRLCMPLEWFPSRYSTTSKWRSPRRIVRWQRPRESCSPIYASLCDDDIARTIVPVFRAESNRVRICLQSTLAHLRYPVRLCSISRYKMYRDKTSTRFGPAILTMSNLYRSSGGSEDLYEGRALSVALYPNTV